MSPMIISMKFFIIYFLFTNLVSFSATAVQVSYADHCASDVPESTVNLNAASQHVHLIHGGYYYPGGGNQLLDICSPDMQVKNSVDFQSLDIRETHVHGLFKIESILEFKVTHRHELQSLPPIIMPGSVSFRLNGFWSESSGKLCMVGSSSSKWERGNPPVVLKLYNLINSTSITSLITGTLENVLILENHPNKHLGPISILMFPRMNYMYTLVSDESNYSYSSRNDDPPSSSQVERFCPLLSSIVVKNDYPLSFSNHCTTAKSCTPVSSSDLPQAVLFKYIVCSEDDQLARVMIEFTDGKPNERWTMFNPNITLVGEGSWDRNQHQLSVVACRFLDTTNSLITTNVGDCSTRLNLRILAKRMIGSTSSIVGEIWSTKNVTESGYFNMMTFANRDCNCRKGLLPGQTYEYTKMDKVTKLCSRKKTAIYKAGVYPNPFLHGRSFIMHAQNAQGRVEYGNCVPLSVDNSIYQTDWSSREDACAPQSSQEYSVSPRTLSYNHSNPINISYKIDLQLHSNTPLWEGELGDYQVHINAEGIYDGTEGNLCMVGCRKLGTHSQNATDDSMDCEVLVNFQFSSTDAKDLGHIKGRIESTRKRSDPLHFECLALSTAAKNDDEQRSIWMMDEKLTVVLISTTLAFGSAALQFIHVKTNPEVIPSISILMLLLLTLGYMLPLRINLEAMFTHNFDNENVHIVIWVTTLLAFLILFHLMKLTWSEKSGKRLRKNIQIMERKAIFVTLQVYVAGAVASLFLHRKILKTRNTNNELPHASAEYSLLDVVTCHGSLVLDGFLFPQILLNMFCKSRENALSVWFYIGTTVARVLPHTYDLYRAHSPANDNDCSYSYLGHVEDLYFMAWNSIIPLGSVLFAGVIYLQQPYGVGCVAPERLQETEHMRSLRTMKSDFHSLLLFSL